jgi:hypothetical protein
MRNRKLSVAPAMRRHHVLCYQFVRGPYRCLRISIGLKRKRIRSGTYLPIVHSYRRTRSMRSEDWQGQYFVHLASYQDSLALGKIA